MANLDGPFGLSPLNSPGGTIKLRRYNVTASYATSIFIGDPVVRVAAGTISLATAGDSNPVLGAAMGFFDGAGRPQNYYLGGSTDSWTLLVSDDPNQEYIIQEDNVTSDIALADRGLNFALVATAAGSTVTGLSGWELNSNTGAATATEQIRLIDLLEAPDNALGDYAVWVVKINNHQALQGVVGVGI